MAAKIKTLHDLGVDLLGVYSELRAGRIDQKTADALANVAGKVIQSLRVQVEYNAFKNNIDRIQLLESVDSKKMIKASANGHQGEMDTEYLNSRKSI